MEAVVSIVCSNHQQCLSIWFTRAWKCFENYNLKLIPKNEEFESSIMNEKEKIPGKKYPGGSKIVSY